MRILPFILFFTAFWANAQKPEIISITTDERILHGHIGEEYPITVYLKAANASDNVGYIYSVKGWYQYDNIGTPIPLAGIWTGGQLHLFASADQQFLDNLTQFTYKGGDEDQYLDNYIYDLETFTADLPEITERFHLDFEEYRIAGNWKNKDKSFWVSINSNSSKIVTTANYLKLPEGSYFDLANLGIPDRSEVEIQASANGGKNLVLHYSYHANLNYMGRCGGAVDSGKIGLVFDDDHQLLSYTDALFESCYQDLIVDDLIKISEKETKYKIYDYSASKALYYQVDSKNATLKLVTE